MGAAERNQNLAFPVPQYSCCLNAAHENSFLPFFSPMLGFSNCVRVDMVLTEDGRRKSVAAHETACFFCGSVSSRKEIWSTVSFLQFCCLALLVLLRRWEESLVTCTDGTSFVLGCKWTRMDKLIRSEQHFSFSYLFNVVETQLGLWTWIWGVYSREILKSYELAFRKHLVYAWKLTVICCFSLYPILNILPCSFYPQDLYKLLTIQLK